MVPRILGYHQKAYVPSKFISEVTKNTYYLFHYAKQHNKPGLGLLIDFEKAFDSVSFKFIKTTVDIFGFGPAFKN